MADDRFTAFDVELKIDSDGVYAALVNESRVRSFGWSIDEAVENLKDATALWYDIPLPIVDVLVQTETETVMPKRDDS